VNKTCVTNIVGAIFSMMLRNRYNPGMATPVRGMTAKDFRRIALSLDGAEEGSHMGAVDFRVGGRIFATLAAIKQGYGNLMLTPEQQAEFCAAAPEIFLAIPGGWGKSGATHMRLANATEDVVEGALRAAWKVRLEKNAQVKTRRPATSPNRAAAARSSRAPRSSGSGGSPRDSR
jgi:hypothetical protein